MMLEISYLDANIGDKLIYLREPTVQRALGELDATRSTADVTGASLKCRSGFGDLDRLVDLHAYIAGGAFDVLCPPLSATIVGLPVTGWI